jgi:monothiol glutaredoxin
MSMTPDLKDRIDAEIKNHPVVLFMKGNKLFPMCGFSSRAVAVLKEYGDLHTVDVLQDPELREGIKEYSQWPTIPQAYIRGEFVGGSDILMELHERGELEAMIRGS